MTSVRWTEPALADIEHISAWVAERDEDTARRLVARLYERTRTLATSPLQGRPGRIPDTRELTVGGTRYLILYRVLDDIVELLRVIHTSRDWPPEPE